MVLASFAGIWSSLITTPIPLLPGDVAVTRVVSTGSINQLSLPPQFGSSETLTGWYEAGLVPTKPPPTLCQWGTEPPPSTASAMQNKMVGSGLVTATSPLPWCQGAQWGAEPPPPSGIYKAEQSGRWQGWLALRFPLSPPLLSSRPFRELNFPLCLAATEQCESALNFPSPCCQWGLSGIWAFTPTQRQWGGAGWCPTFTGNKNEAELSSHPSAKKQCESLLHFCQGGVGGAQQEAEHTHSPCPHTTPQLVDCLLEKIK